MIGNYKRLLNLILQNNEEETQGKNTYLLYYRKNKNTDKEENILIGASESKNDLIDFLRFKTNKSFKDLKKHNKSDYDFWIEKTTD